MPSATDSVRAALKYGTLPTLVGAFVMFFPFEGAIDRNGYHYGRDFTNFWIAARLIVENRLPELYNLVAYHDYMKSALYAEHPFMNFSYPPHSLLFLWPLGLIDFAPALLIWTALGASVFVSTVLIGLKLELRKPIAPLVLLTPISIFVLAIGQASFFFAALFVGAFLAMPRRPIATGAMLGILTVKPQIGVLVAVVLLVQRQYRVIAAGTITTLVLVGLSVLVFGLEPWRDYAAYTIPYQEEVVRRMVGFSASLMVTPYAGFWRIGFSHPTALVLHGLIAAAIVASVIHASLRYQDHGATLSLVALGSVLVTPYCLLYDLAIPTAALLILVGATKDFPFRSSTDTIMTLFIAAPFAAVPAFQSHVPLMPIIALALFVMLSIEQVYRAREGAWRAVPVGAMS